MKKTLIIFGILYLVFSSALTFAQTSQTASDYQLPYPGILPDNPLYRLKTLRDRIVEIFISDPEKRSEFDLLQADKRLSVGIALFDKGEKDLSEQTISKGENYFEEAIKNVKTAKKEGREINPVLLQNLNSSSKKHKEVLQNLMQKSSRPLEQKFQKQLQRVSKFVGDVGELQSK